MKSFRCSIPLARNAALRPPNAILSLLLLPPSKHCSHTPDVPAPLIAPEEPEWGPAYSSYRDVVEAPPCAFELLPKNKLDHATDLPQQTIVTANIYRASTMYQALLLRTLQVLSHLIQQYEVGTIISTILQTKKLCHNILICQSLYGKYKHCEFWLQTLSCNHCGTFPPLLLNPFPKAFKIKFLSWSKKAYRIQILPTTHSVFTKHLTLGCIPLPYFFILKKHSWYIILY